MGMVPLAQMTLFSLCFRYRSLNAVEEVPRGTNVRLATDIVSHHLNLQRSSL